MTKKKKLPFFKKVIREKDIDNQELKVWEKRLADQVPFVDVKPFSHNIIAICLQAIAKKYGKAKANELIDKYDLESLGWSKVND